MDFFLNIYNLFVYQPLLNALILFYQYLPGRDLGVAVIALTFFIRVALHPLSVQGIRAQQKMAALQPRIRELQERFKSSKEQQTRALLELYKKEKINPFAGLVPLLIQLPIFIALYHLLARRTLSEQGGLLYAFVLNPGTIDPTFLGVINLAEKSIPLALGAGLSQFLQSKQASLSSPKAARKEGKLDFASAMQTQMLYFFPVFTVVIAAQLPAAFGLYWIATNIFSVVQYWFIARARNAQLAGRNPQPVPVTRNSP